jgi:hypothetical protein
MKILDKLKEFFSKGPKPIIPNKTTQKAIEESRKHHHNHGSSTT